MVYLVTYELHQDSIDYNEIFHALKMVSNGAWCHFWENAWLVRSHCRSAGEVYRKLRPLLGPEDRCLVIEVRDNKDGLLTGDEWAFINRHVFAEYP